MGRELNEKIKAIFSHDGQLDFPVLGIFVLINLIVLTNTIFHHPKIGYDVVEHITYMQIIVDKLPDKDDSHEFFSPPLPYILPGVFDKACEAILDDEPHVPFEYGGYFIQECRRPVGKFAQSINVLLSISALFVALLICEYTRPGNRFYKISTLTLFSVLTVYYKTFSQARAEPYVVFFILLSIYWLLRSLEEYPPKGVVIFLGISLGLLMLSRQWGFFIFPAIGISGIWLLQKNYTKAIQRIKPLVASLILAFVIGGWFYLHLYVQYGTFTAFNIEETQTLSFTETLTLVRQTGLGNFEIFKEPIRPNFDKAPLPIFYSDTWGDYWGYFTFIKESSYHGALGLHNKESIGPYLGRVNLVSIIPTLILLAGWILGTFKFFGIRQSYSIKDASSALFFSIATVSIIGYSIFLANFYLQAKSTVKATYIIQFFIMLVFLGAEFLEWLRKKSPSLYIATLVALGFVFIHNLPAFISRYVLYPWISAS